MNNNFRTIDNSELEDFDTECRALGFNPNEFSLQEHDIVEKALTNATFTINGKVTITKNKKSKTYLTGNATHWVADFTDDLQKDFFK